MAFSLLVKAHTPPPTPDVTSPRPSPKPTPPPDKKPATEDTEARNALPPRVTRRHVYGLTRRTAR